MTMTIQKALAELDPLKDEHWTTDGMPRVDVVMDLHGSEVTRADITNAAPDFTRLSAVKVDVEGEGEMEAVTLTDEQLAQAKDIVRAKQEGAEVTNADAAHAQAQAEEGAEDAPEAAPDADDAPEAAPDADDAPEAAPDADEVNEEEEDAPSEVSVTEPFPKPQVQVELTDLEKVEEELAEATVIMEDAQRAATEAKVASDRSSDVVNAINRRIEVMHKKDPNHGTAGIRAYLKQQNENRLNRAKGLQRFVDATGVSASDIGIAINPKSPIDQAMQTRKPKRGSARPNYNNR